MPFRALSVVLQQKIAVPLHWKLFRLEIYFYVEDIAFACFCQYCVSKLLLHRLKSLGEEEDLQQLLIRMKV